jgi:lipid-A-disaccharide synthase
MGAAVDSAAGPLIFFVVGEPSGDALGASLMAALREQTGGRIRFAGVGGEAMTAEGLESLYPISELAVMGIVEIVPHLFQIYRRIREAAAAAAAMAPAAVITIDSPSFTLEVSQRLKGKGIALIHYVAPSVWVWKPWRARQIARFLDHLLTLLPFEPPYFEVHGLAATFVGHPAVEQAVRPEAGAAVRERCGIAGDAPVLCMLPGSRKGEVARLLPVFEETVTRLSARFPGLRVLTPTVATVSDAVAAAVRRWPVPVTVVVDAADKQAAFAACDVALAASGTVAVELAAAETPVIVAYKVSAMSAMLFRLLTRIRFASVVNLVLDREVQPEHLQKDCTPDRLVDAVGGLLTDQSARETQIAGCREALALLGSGGEAPSHRAARAVLNVIGAEGEGSSAYTGEQRREAT